MHFTVRNQNETVVSLARKIGYQPIRVDADNEYSLVRLLSRGRFPRFHIYVKRDEKVGEFDIDLHLDQKQPSYEGSHAHSGEYGGELVEQEAQRIKSVASF